MAKRNADKKAVVGLGWGGRIEAPAVKPAEGKTIISSYKLFVDDMREIPAGWIGCRTVSEAIAILAHLPVSEVSLDHDIISSRGNGSLYQALSSETYKGVAYYIAAMPPEHRPKIRIHTANAGAAHTMCEILGVPFDTTYAHYAPENYK